MGRHRNRQNVASLSLPPCAGVYRLDVAGLFYVGSAKNMERQADIHLTRIRRGTHPIRALVVAAQSDPNAVRFTMLEACPAALRAFREQYWLEALYRSAGKCLNRKAAVSVKRRRIILTALSASG